MLSYYTYFYFREEKSVYYFIKYVKLPTAVFHFILGHWITVAPYTAKSDDELSYRAGEEVEVLATSNFGWWKIR